MNAELPDFAPARVLVVGDLMLDRYWIGPTSRISPEAPVPVVRIRKDETRPGGAANVALNIASLGASAAVLEPSVVVQRTEIRPLRSWNAASACVPVALHVIGAVPAATKGDVPSKPTVFDATVVHPTDCVVEPEFHSCRRAPFPVGPDAGATPAQ